MSNLAQNITLQPWPKTSSVDEEALRTTLDRIYVQKGHFRHITEESLEKELQDETGEDAESDNSEAETAGELAKKEVEAFNKAKADMIQHVSVAHNAAYQALDFVSLLLSKDAPQKANISLSPFMKQNVPPGILTYDIWPSAAPPQAQQEAQMTAAQGWRMKSLTSAADKLAEAALRLEKTLKTETKYWEQVLSVTENGWSVRRVDSERNRHTLGVQFGSLEAGAQFRSRGFAALETDDDGAVVLNRQLTRMPKAIRVRFLKNTKVWGSSNIPKISQKDASIEVLIHRARDSLFDEELFHEILLETRQLEAYGVHTQEGIIRIPVSASSAPAAVTRDVAPQILIDLIPLVDAGLTAESRNQDDFANYIATGLRILLSHTYRRRQKQRTQVPQPMSEEPRKPVPSAILRPILTILRHQLVVQGIQRYLREAHDALRAAGLNIKAEVSHDTLAHELEAIVKAQGDAGSALERLTSALCAPMVASILITLPSSTAKVLKGEVRTSYTSPDVGPTYTLHLEPSIMSLIFQTPPTEAVHGRTLQFGTATEMMEYVSEILVLDIAHHVIGSELPDWQVEPCLPQVVMAAEGKQSRLIVQLKGRKLVLLNGKRVEHKWDGHEGQQSLKQVIAKLAQV